MNNKHENIKDEFYCKICNKKYKTYKTLWEHNKKSHGNNVTKCSTNVQNCSNINQNNLNKSLLCDICNKIFKSRSAKSMHKQKCKENNNHIELNKLKEHNDNIELNKLKEKNKEKELEIILKKQEEKILELKMKLDYQNESINKNLINMIVNKTKAIGDLKTKINTIEENKDNQIVEIKKELPTLNLNNVIIVSRLEDNYINATQLCQAGGKKFNHWYSLDTTKELINTLELEIKNETVPDAGITASATYSLIEINKGGNDKNNQITWIHPDLAVQLAQWISPKFALQVSKWIRTLFTNGTVSVDIKLLEDKEKEIKLKDQKIQLLEDTYNRKQKRENYPLNNLIYLLTTENHKKERIYIIGKTTNLKHRLSNYNKTEEHTVVYYKECNTKKSMDLGEVMIINMLSDYKIKANRDRFILPLEKDISYFINIINDCIDFVDKTKNNIEISHFWITLDNNGTILDPTIKQFNPNELPVYFGNIQENATTSKYIKNENIGDQAFAQTYELWAAPMFQDKSIRQLPPNLENKFISFNVATAYVLMSSIS